jgi:hypothetical protein
VPSATLTPCRAYAAQGKVPLPSRAFERGQCTTAQPARCRRRRSSSSTWTAWTRVGRASRTPSSSRYPTGRPPRGAELGEEAPEGGPERTVAVAMERKLAGVLRDVDLERQALRRREARQPRHEGRRHRVRGVRREPHAHAAGPLAGSEAPHHVDRGLEAGVGVRRVGAQDLPVRDPLERRVVEQEAEHGLVGDDVADRADAGGLEERPRPVLRRGQPATARGRGRSTAPMKSA